MIPLKDVRISDLLKNRTLEDFYKPFAKLRFSHIFQRTLNFTNDIVNVFQDIIVPKAQDFVPMRFKKFCALGIVFILFQVLAVIQFDDEFTAWSAEVHHIVANSMLAAKTDIV